MRHLLVPACVCVMTLAGATGTDSKLSMETSKLSLEKFSGRANKNNKNDDRASTPAAPGEPVHADIPIDESTADIARETPESDTQFKIAEPIPLPPIAKPVVHRSPREICESLTDAAKSNDLPVPFFISLLFQESRFNAGVVSPAGAQGIAQFMPETATDMGLKNPFDPLQAIPASARLLRNLVAQFGNLGLAAAAYNAGPRRIQEWLGKKGKLPDETKGYVKTITGRPAENWTAASAAHPGQRLPRRAPCQEAAGLYAWSGPATIPLPARSPLAQRDETPVSKRTVVVSVAAATTAKAAKTAKAESASPVKIAQHGTRVAAIIDVAKVAVKDVVRDDAKPKQSAAAHVIKVASHKSEKPKLAKIAQR